MTQRKDESENTKNRGRVRDQRKDVLDDRPKIYRR